jgi:hypothetical protein
MDKRNSLFGCLRVDSSDRSDFFADESDPIPRKNRHVFQACSHKPGTDIAPGNDGFNTRQPLGP